MSPFSLLLLFASYDVGPFPKPDAASAFAELKAPARLAKEDWDGARRRAKEAAWAPWLKTRRAELDEWMAKRRDRVEWVAGWWHDFVNDTNGDFLEWTPEEPSGVTPKVHGGWVFGFRSRHTEKVLEAARMARLTGEPKYSEWAASQLDFYAENWAKWPIQTSKSKARLMHQSLDDANVLVRLVNAARLLDPPAERRARWIDGLFRPQAMLLDETFQSIHNIACWQRSAMAQTALYAKDEELWKHAIDGPYGVRKQVEHGITSEYLWFEQSFGYNSYVVSALQPLFTMAALEGRGGDLTAERDAAWNMMLAPILLRFPNGQLPNPADSTGGLKKVPSVSFLASAYRVFPTHLGLREAAKLRNWDTLLDPPPAPGDTRLPPPPARDWSSSRMAVLQGGDWQVYVHYGQIHRSHAQAEALNFEAFHGATDVTHDPGTVGYGSPLHAGFYRTGFAHNVAFVDRQGQAGWQPGEMVEFSPTRIVARQPKYRPDAQVTREMKIDGKRLVDSLTVNGKGGSVGMALHLQGRIEFAGDASDFTPPQWKDVKQARAVDSVTLPVRFDGKTMRVTVATPGEFTVRVGRSPDVPPRMRDSVYVEKAGSAAAFVTTVEP